MNSDEEKTKNDLTNDDSLNIREEEAVYSTETVPITDAKEDQLAVLYAMTQRVYAETPDSPKRKLWAQSAEYVLHNYPFETLNEYVALTAKAEILFNLSRYEDVISLLESESSPVRIEKLFNDNLIKHENFGEHGTRTPRILAIKSLALGQTDKLPEAIRELRKVCVLINSRNPIYENRECISTFSVDLHPLSFLRGEPYEKILKEDEYWKGGVLFTTESFNYQLLEAYKSSFSCDNQNLIAETISIGPIVIKNNYKIWVNKITRLLETNPDHYLLLYCMARFLYVDKKFDEALEYYGKSIISNPEFGDAYYQRAKLFEKQERYSNALNDYDAAVKVDRTYAEAFYRRGNLKLQLNQFDSACKDFDSAKKLNPILNKKIKFDNLEQSISTSLEQEERISQEERHKVIRNLAHTLKNITASVISPLKNSTPDESISQSALQCSIRGVELINETVNALSVSFRGEPDDFVNDVQEALRCDSARSMSDILITAILSVVDCMFDSTYYNAYCHRYFKNQESFNAAKRAWKTLKQSPEIEELTDFLETHMVSFSFTDQSLLKDMLIGDFRNSPMKLTILFKELLLTAFKNACYTPRLKRFIRIDFAQNDESLDFIISNAIEGNFDRSTKPGMEIVNNIVHQVNGNLTSKNANGVFATTFSMPNIFANNRKD